MQHVGHVGFACSWWRPRASTWSYIPHSLSTALRAHRRVGIVDAQPPLPVQALFAAAARGPVPWKYWRAYRRLEDRRVNAAARHRGFDALLTMADLVAEVDLPAYVYQDMSFSVAAALYGDLGPRLVSVLPSPRGRLEVLADVEHERLQRQTAVFAMSRWYRDWLVERHGLPAERVHVVGAGVNVVADAPPEPRAGGRRVLFVGSEFLRKGGDLVVDAVACLRAGGDDVVLTVAGPTKWPLPGEPPAFVTFAGRVERAVVAELLRTHDVFAMPSRFEAYGIAFLEAQAAGLPVVARRAFAMPELVDDGVTGLLWDGRDRAGLAQRLHRALHDLTLRESAWRCGPVRAATHTWDAVARRILDVMERQ